MAVRAAFYSVHCDRDGCLAWHGEGDSAADARRQAIAAGWAASTLEPYDLCPGHKDDGREPISGDGP